jgi:uncharacterized membrane protein YkoI
MSSDRTSLSRVTLMALFLLMSCVLPGLVNAQTLVDPRQRGEKRVEAPAISMDRAVQMAERQYNARAVRAEPVTSGNRTYYQIRLLNSEGKVWTVRVDAMTGQIH